MTYKTQAKLLRTKRTQLAISQMEIAGKLGYTSAQFISNWERGISAPPATTARKLCKMLKIDRAVMAKARRSDQMRKLNVQMQAFMK